MTKNEKRHPNTADILTAFRMAGSLALLFLRPLSAAFFWVYLLTGLTDVLDGWIARKTRTASDFGARLDSMADLLFYAVMLLRLFPALWGALPKGIWYCVAVIVLVRISIYLIAAVKYRRFASLHTYLNKLTGLAVFMVPLLLMTPCAVGYCWAVCAVSAAASWEELAIHLLTRDYNPNTKTIRTVLRERSSEHENSCL